MSNTWFHFKQFTIQQENASMKVGTDGVLLGAWTSVPGPGSRVLDIGTGTGLIALMIAQRTRLVAVDAVELAPASARQAEENFRNSPWKERMRCVESSFQDYASTCKRMYDLIVCNPPFFSASSKTPCKEKNLARHDDTLSLKDIIEGSIPLLNKTAALSLVLPVQKEMQAMDVSSEYGLYCRRLTRVKPAPGKPVKRVLLEFSFLSGEVLEDELVIETQIRHHYSDKFKALVNEFYLEP